MALTGEDKIYLEKTFATKAELNVVKVELAGVTAELSGVEVGQTSIKEDVRRLELLMEHGLDDLRRILGDIIDWVKEVSVHRERLDEHDTAIGQLNRTVYGYDSTQH